MTETKSPTVSLRVPARIKSELERAAIEISYTTGRTIPWTQVALYLLGGGDFRSLEAHFIDGAKKNHR